MLTWKRCLAGLFAVVLGALGCHVPGPTTPETPKAGVPSIEFEFLKRCVAVAGLIIRRLRERRTILFAGILLGGALVYVTDPFGALDWWFD